MPSTENQENQQELFVLAPSTIHIHARKARTVQNLAFIHRYTRVKFQVMNRRLTVRPPYRPSSAVTTYRRSLRATYSYRHTIGAHVAKYASYELMLLHRSMNSSVMRVLIGVVTKKREGAERFIGVITKGDDVDGMKFTGGDPSISV